MIKDKYWYFRFPNDFFRRQNIKYLLKQTGGSEKLIILLKLYAESTAEHGVLKIRYNPLKNDGVERLAILIEEDVIALKDAIQYFVTERLLIIEEQENMTILHFEDVKNLVGESSRAADRRRLNRNHQKEIEEQKYPELEYKNAVDNNEDKKAFGKFKNVFLTADENEDFCSMYRNAKEIIERYSVWKKIKNPLSHSDYAYLLSFAEKDGVKITAEYLKAQEIKSKRAEAEKSEEIRKNKRKEEEEKYPELKIWKLERIDLIKRKLTAEKDERETINKEIDKLNEKVKLFRLENGLD